MRPHLVSLLRPHSLRCALAAMTFTAACQGLPHEDTQGGKGGKADDIDCEPSGLVTLAPTFTTPDPLSQNSSAHSFDLPIALVQLPDSQRWLLAEKAGRIWTFTAGSDGALLTAPSLAADLRAQIESGPNEAGLLGMALSPTFASDARIYLSYTVASSQSAANLRSVVSRALLVDDGLNTPSLDATTEEVLLAVDQPFSNHNGGHIAFGPDGMLYLGLGDGGSAGDPQNRAQNLASPFGKLLRVDVSGSQGYTVPSDNPFVGANAIEEIYAYGLRNPWRFSFDSVTGRLWLGDVGQNAFEEIDLIEAGGNYGWKHREAAHCFSPSVGCESQGLVDPVAEYGRDEGFSVTGGYAYRGQALPDMDGRYVFGDFGSGNLWSLTEETDGSFTRDLLLGNSGANIASFAQDNAGELYALDFASGHVLALKGATCDSGDADAGVAPEPEADADVPEPDAEPLPQAVSFAEVYDIIESRCAPCHVGGSSGGLAMGTEAAAFAALVDAPASAAGACSGRTRVLPGEATSSVLFQKLSGVDLCGSKMPPFGAALSAEDLSLVQAWIDEGAAP